MKLVIINAISEYNKDVKAILKNVDVRTYTYKEVRGHKDLTEEAIESNWFASEFNETDSTLFYAFVKIEHIDKLFCEVNHFNKKQDSASKIHIAVLNIEKSN